ncbi:SDR family NAD(P)-dependent oxidoreductase [Microbacterium sp.]|uniref:SDR family NAD(P)-dependent oxidoreductase n=1 Tax=Microbacterium sp. TaxID=51671 RepID=UPI002BD8D2A0|nr:SDR family NAD(P)-dependent oxidoreductase [Microbacterium sp.]HWL77682.1 SDR family NAD(P)-dependent oxidoreductase [Microbacterium sp.]
MVALAGRVAIVTGGGRGLGRAHCHELARRGAAVVVNDLGVSTDGSRTERTSPASEVVEEIRAFGGTAWAHEGSVTDAADCDRLVAEAVARFGRLDIVVNNAGILRSAPLVETSPADFEAVVAVHLTGTFLLTRAAAVHWAQRRSQGEPVSGRVINTTSSVGMMGQPEMAAYAAAKAGILGLTLTTAKELADLGVTCNAVSPVAATRMTTHLPWNDGAVGDRYSPFDPRNVSPLVAYLASEDASWLTGQVLRIEGNSVIRMHPWGRGEVYRASDEGGFVTADELDRGLRGIYGVFPPAMLSDATRSA